jgi:hypothetical protein
MPHPKIVFQITLPEQVDPEAFETFMTDRYFPAVHWGPTRVGQATGLSLWRRAENSEHPSRTYLMEYGFAGLLGDRLPRVSDDAVQADFETYRPYFEPLGPFTERVTVSEPSEPAPSEAAPAQAGPSEPVPSEVAPAEAAEGETPAHTGR